MARAKRKAEAAKTVWRRAMVAAEMAMVRVQGPIWKFEFMTIPITVFTGFLGAGKTSVILSLLPKLPKDYIVVLLKNEFGDVQVDSKLAHQSSLAAVSEILNGCMSVYCIPSLRYILTSIQVLCAGRPDADSSLGNPWLVPSPNETIRCNQQFISSDNYRPDRIIIECS